MSAQSDSATEYSKGPMIRAGFDVKKFRDNYEGINWSKKPDSKTPVSKCVVCGDPSPCRISLNRTQHDA
jgi:hypothetical protein